MSRVFSLSVALDLLPCKGLFGFRHFKKPPAKLFGFGKFSGLLYGNWDCQASKALTNMSGMTMPALLIHKNIFRLSGPRKHLDVHQ